MINMGLNHESVKLRNRQNILRLISDSGAMSRKDIAQKMHLTSAAVTQICNELIENGEIIECGTIENSGRAGRKKILVDINGNHKYICSIVIEKYYSFVTITDLKAKVIDSVQINTNNLIEPTIFIEKLKDIALSLFEKYNLSKDNMLGIGVSVVGVVDKQNGVSLHAYGIWDEPVPIKEILNKYIDVDIIVENNVSSFAQAEIIYGMGKCYDSLLFVRWHPGIGGAFIIDGRLHKDHEGKTTELGHIITGVSKKKCKCGKIGCLETMVSSSSILEQIKEVYSEQRTPRLYELTNGDIDNVNDVMEELYLKEDMFLDEEIRNIIDRAIRQVAKTIVNTVALMTPDKVVLWGKFFRNKYILQYFYKSCAKLEGDYDAIKMIKSDLDKKSTYIGGVAIAYNDLFISVKN